MDKSAVIKREKKRPKRRVVFVDPQDPDAPYWWPAMVVPAEEFDIFKMKMDNDVTPPNESEYLVCYFEDASFSLVKKNESQPFNPRSLPFLSYLRGPNADQFRRDKAVIMATLYWETGRMPPLFKWVRDEERIDILELGALYEEGLMLRRDLGEDGSVLERVRKRKRRESDARREGNAGFVSENGGDPLSPSDGLPSVGRTDSQYVPGLKRESPSDYGKKPASGTPASGSNVTITSVSAAIVTTSAKTSAGAGVGGNDSSPGSASSMMPKKPKSRQNSTSAHTHPISTTMSASTGSVPVTSSSPQHQNISAHSNTPGTPPRSSSVSLGDTMAYTKHCYCCGNTVQKRMARVVCMDCTANIQASERTKRENNIGEMKLLLEFLPPSKRVRWTLRSKDIFTSSLV
ncbi:uncharacterized protein VTP21DRAFT_887 [Calcarisporiella thermophila]|uniref:uncharacterized protein n=1 Tax=Calcarisporiella thermophila TaxID=911321 RepID=UPI003742F113